MAAIFNPKYLDIVEPLTETERAVLVAAGQQSWDTAAAQQRAPKIDDFWEEELLRK